MSRYANGNTPTGEYRSSREYDAGYRDGYHAVRERFRSETAHLRHMLDSMTQALADAAKVSQLSSFTVTAEEAKRLNIRLPDES